MRFPLSLLATICLAGAPAALADDTASQSRALFQRAQGELSSGNSDEALADLEKAYALNPSPSLLFYLGEARRLHGDKARALAYYKEYLAKQPDGSQRAAAESRIAELEKIAAPKRQAKKREPAPAAVARDSQANAPAAPAAGAAPPKPAIEETPAPAPLIVLDERTREATRKISPPPDAAPAPAVETERPVTLVRTAMMGGGAVLGVAGLCSLAISAGFGIASHNAANLVTETAESHQPFNPADESRGELDQRRSTGFLIGGGAGLAAGVLLIVFAPAAPRERSYTFVADPLQSGSPLAFRF